MKKLALYLIFEIIFFLPPVRLTCHIISLKVFHTTLWSLLLLLAMRSENGM